jgi:hypothetical protein
MYRSGADDLRHSTGEGSMVHDDASAQEINVHPELHAAGPLIFKYFLVELKGSAYIPAGPREVPELQQFKGILLSIRSAQATEDVRWIQGWKRKAWLSYSLQNLCSFPVDVKLL